MPNKAGWSPIAEGMFLEDYRKYAQKLGLSPNPDDPLHFYDYRAAWAAGQLRPDGSGHLSSAFKLPGHPRFYVSPDGKDGSPVPRPGWLNTKTGEYFQPNALASLMLAYGRFGR